VHHSLRFVFRTCLARVSVSLLLLASPAVLAAQSDSQHTPNTPSDQATAQVQDKDPTEQLSDRTVPSLKNLPGDIFRDQKFLWARPFRFERKDASWDAAISGTTAGILVLDKHVAQNLADSPPGGGFAFSRRAGQASSFLPQVGICSAFYLVGRWRGNEKSRSSGLLGMRAVVNSAIVVEVLKTATQRPRPTKPDGVTLDHNADGQFFAGGRSFPSGHAAEAWALAAVISGRYSQRRWVPPTAYGLAGLVAVCRVVQRRHFPSDVFVGAAIGYLIGRHISGEGPDGAVEKTKRSRLLPQFTLYEGTNLQVVWRF
jgi:membrane-associated phospholipid phosphatase